MDLKEVMEQKNFVVVGDTLNEDKYAHKIKRKLLDKGYNVHAVGKELATINDIKEDIDIINLCINPVKGLAFMQECKKPVKAVVMQPGAESPELRELLKTRNIEYLESCVLVGLKLYKK